LARLLWRNSPYLSSPLFLEIEGKKGILTDVFIVAKALGYPLLQAREGEG